MSNFLYSSVHPGLISEHYVALLQVLNNYVHEHEHLEGKTPKKLQLKKKLLHYKVDTVEVVKKMKSTGLVLNLF